MINTLKNLSASKLKKDDAIRLGEIDMDIITQAHIDPLIQLEINGYSFKTDEEE